MLPHYDELENTSIVYRPMGYKKTAEMNRTQHKLQLQRQSHLCRDENYLDHPKNMIRLTKELDRMDREYSYIKRFENPIAQSIERLTQNPSMSRPSSPNRSNMADKQTNAPGDMMNALKWLVLSQLSSDTAIDHSLSLASSHPTIIDNIRRRTHS